MHCIHLNLLLKVNTFFVHILDDDGTIMKNIKGDIPHNNMYWGLSYQILLPN